MSESVQLSLARSRLGDMTTIDISAIDQLATGSDDATFYRVTCEILATLRLTSEKQCVLIEAECGGLGEKLRTASYTHDQVFSQLQNVKQEKREQKSTAATQAELIDGLEKTIRKEEADIEILQAKIRKELKRQRNAVLDLIPLRGLIVAIKSGKTKRAIPFYSQIDGIVSAVKGRVTTSRTRMKDVSQCFNDHVLKSSKTKEAHEETLMRIAKLAAKKTAHQNNIYGSDRDTKVTGKKIAHIQAARAHPKQLLSQFDLVEVDLDLAVKLGDATFRSEIIEHLRELVLAQRLESPSFRPHTLERKNGSWVNGSFEK